MSSYGMDSVEHYMALRSGDTTGLWDAVCVTWVQGLPPNEVAHRFSGKPRRLSRRMPIANAVRRHYESSGDDLLMVLAVGQFGDWAVAVEPNGFQGTRPEVLRALTTDNGKAISIYWNENADNELVYVVDGKVVTALDMIMYPEEGATGTDPHALDPYLAGLEFGPGTGHDADPFTAGLAVAERITGVRLDRDWLSARHLQVIIEKPVSNDLIPKRDKGHPVLAEPEIAAIVANPNRSNLRAIAIQAAKIAARRNGVADEPPVATALTALQEGVSSQEAERFHTALLALAEPRRAEFDDERKRLVDNETLAARFHQLRDEAEALTAIAGAFHPDPAEAAHLALFHNPSPNLDEDDGVRLRILRRCERHAISE